MGGGREGKRDQEEKEKEEEEEKEKGDEEEKEEMEEKEEKCLGKLMVTKRSTISRGCLENKEGGKGLGRRR